MLYFWNIRILNYIIYTYFAVSHYFRVAYYTGHSQIEEHICVFSVPAVHMASHKKIINVCVFVLSTNIDEHVLFIMRQLLM